MPSCVACGCSARTDRGDLLKVFPRKDLRRRQVWTERVNRPGWTPNRYSALCQRHFDQDQWEVPREDGKRKLKDTAVPTIFCVEHPSNDDVVAKDHAYCVVGYRQLFYNDEQERAECEGETFPIEHIKLEVDENENISSEMIEEVEDIQCTPDIVVYPEHGEPDPIETVDCEEDEINGYMTEPSNDPLAISAEDVVQADSVEPHFRHSKKYVFVTKDTKYLTPVPGIVKGEPVITSDLPRLRVLSPQQLLRPKTSAVLQSSPQQRIKSPPVPKINTSVSSPPTLNPITQTSFLKPSVEDLSTPKLQVISLSSASPAKLRLLSPLFMQKKYPSVSKLIENPSSNSLRTQSGFSDLQNLKVMTQQPILKPAPGFIRLSPQNTKKIESSSEAESNSQQAVNNNRMILISSDMKKNSFIMSSQKYTRFLHKNSMDWKKKKEVMNYVEPCTQLENIFLEHQYSSRPLWRPQVQLARRVCRVVGNNDLNVWITKKKTIGVNKCWKSSSRLRKIYPKHTDEVQKLKCVPTIRSSSVVVLKPFEKSPSSNHLNFGDSHRDEPSTVNMFQCIICKFTFLKLASLQKHMTTHVESEPTVNSKVRDMFQTEIDVELNQAVGLSSINKNSKEEHLLKDEQPENENKSDIRVESEDNIKEVKAKQVNKEQATTISQRYENDVIRIPNLNIQNTPEIDKFVKLSSLLDTKKASQYSPNVTRQSNQSTKSRKKVKNVIFQASKINKIAKSNLNSLNNISKQKELQEDMDSDVEVDDFNIKIPVNKRALNSRNSLRATLSSGNKPVKAKRTRRHKLQRKCKEVAVILKSNPIVLLSKSSFNGIGKTSESINTVKTDVKDLFDEKSSKSSKDNFKQLKNTRLKKPIEKSLKSNKNDKEGPKLRSSSCGLVVKNILPKSVKIPQHKYKCALCKEMFVKSFQLKRHVESDHKVVNSFICTRRGCGLTFNSKRQLDKHTRTHRSK